MSAVSAEATSIGLGCVVDHPDLGVCGVLDVAPDGRLWIAPVGGEPTVVPRRGFPRQRMRLAPAMELVPPSMVTRRPASVALEAEALEAWMAARRDPSGGWRERVEAATASREEAS